MISHHSWGSSQARRWSFRGGWLACFLAYGFRPELKKKEQEGGLTRGGLDKMEVLHRFYCWSGATTGTMHGGLTVAVLLGRSAAPAVRSMELHCAGWR